MENEVNATDLLIAFLLSAKSTRTMHRIIRERINKRRKISANTFAQSIYRLKKKGLIDVSSRGILITEKGVRDSKNRFNLFTIKPNKTQKMLIIFDIPETERRSRDWLRRQIKFWDFEMIQKSVWLGCGPLPDEFNEYIESRGLEKYIKIFNIKKKG